MQLVVKNELYDKVNEKSKYLLLHTLKSKLLLYFNMFDVVVGQGVSAQFGYLVNRIIQQIKVKKFTAVIGTIDNCFC